MRTAFAAFVFVFVFALGACVAQSDNVAHYCNTYQCAAICR